MSLVFYVFYIEILILLIASCLENEKTNNLQKNKLWKGCSFCAFWHQQALSPTEHKGKKQTNSLGAGIVFSVGNFSGVALQNIAYICITCDSYMK